MDVFTVFLVLGGLLIGYGIGSNDAANCLGTSVGAGVIDYKKAIYLVAILALLGAGLQGSHTISKVGKGIVDAALLSDISIISILFGAGVLVLLFTIFGLPVSTTMAVIGGVAGIGALLKVFVMWKSVIIIFAAGFLTPVIGAILSYITYRGFNYAFSRYNFLWFEKILGFIVIVSGGFLAYSLGANNIGNAMGLVVERGIMGPLVGGFVGGLALAFGSLSLGKRVMKTVGRDITELDPVMAFTSQTGAAITVYILTMLAIPTSTTFAIVGGVAGTGLVKGVASVDRQVIKKIMFGWVLTPILGALFAIGLFKLLSIIT